MVRQRFHSICRITCLAGVIVLLASVCGCTTWDLQRFHPNNFRDERAVDIDRRLEGSKTLMPSPF